jgi:hypothetical protein
LNKIEILEPKLEPRSTERMTAGQTVTSSFHNQLLLPEDFVLLNLENDFLPSVNIVHVLILFIDFYSFFLVNLDFLVT